MSFLKGFFRLFDWMFPPKTYQEMSDDLDESMQELYDKNGWGKYNNPINCSYNKSIDYTRSISSEEWNNMIKQNKTVEEVYGYISNKIQK